MEKIWLSNYPEGVPEEIDPTQYNSLVELFQKSCEQFADRVAFDNLGCELTYAQFYDKAKVFASYLENELGLQKGDRVAIMLPNCLQYPVVMLGTMLAGCVVVNVNPLYTPRELEHQLCDSMSETIIIMENFANVLQQCKAKTPIKNVITTQLADFFPGLKRIIVNFVVKKIKKLVPPWDIEGAIKLNHAMKLGAKGTLTPVQLHRDDIAYLQYTGGTTGVAKGAELTHSNMIANVLQALAWLKAFSTKEQEIIVTALPLYHIFSLTANLLTFTIFGAKNILITNPKDIPQFVSLIKDSKFTSITGVNTLFNALANDPKFPEVDFSELGISLGGGTSVQQAVAQKWKKITGCALSEGYGLTECCPLVTINPLDAGYTGCIGLPAPSTEISIRNDEGIEVPIGTEGELCVRGPQVMRGYWKRPDETEQTFYPEGWLRTGDIVSIDEKGFVKMLERKKDMIDVSGFNVYPIEVEDILGRHPGILEAAVVGVDGGERGEKVKAFVVRTDENLEKDAIIDFARKSLTAYKVPKEIEFRDELPKSPIGKILRRVLREEDAEKQKNS